MIYFANPCAHSVVDAMIERRLGLIDTPAQSKTERLARAHAGHALWCADNGAFSDRFDLRRWWAFLESKQHLADTCIFAVAPDVVGDARATMERSAPHLQPMRDLGYQVAFVAQDGLQDLDVPWEAFDCLFIGGTTEWKLSLHVWELAVEAQIRGKWLHMGRVNSLRRLRIASHIGCNSVDGTHLTFEPDRALVRVLGWLDTVRLERGKG